MFKVGERVRYYRPLDEDYTYGIILEINEKTVIVKCIGNYTGLTEVSIKHLIKVKKAGDKFGNRKKYSKRSVIKTKL